ncbi:MAG: sigma-70 family RNA polymerase sigma factor [Actinomycetota bacterium]
MPGSVPGDDEVARAFRAAHGQAVATVARLVGDLATAEDAVQDAFVVAVQRWPVDGIPPNPAGWIVTTARRRAIDVHRRAERGRELAEEAERHEEEAEVLVEEAVVPDDRLRLIFTCCHPALRMEHRVALTLRLLGGLEVDEIARGFVISEAAMAKRLTRAKYKIRATSIPYRVPAAHELPDRLAGVLAVLYLIHTAGHGSPDGGGELRSEAVRLARALVELMPDEPEAAGLLALLVLSEARIPARVGGEVVLLRHQDRRRWDTELIAEGHAIVRACIRRDAPGPYQLQAAIQAVHCAAVTYEDTDWPQIVELYDHLLQLQPTAIVALNRAVAVLEVDGAEAALDDVDAIAGELDAHAPWHAVRGEMLERLGRNGEAAASFASAAALSVEEPDRRHLLERARALSDG